MKNSTTVFAGGVLSAGILAIALSVSAQSFSSSTIINKAPGINVKPVVKVTPVFINAAATTVASTAESTTSCPVVSEFMKVGIANKPSQVTRLQTFLKASESADVDVNGVFDDKTEKAVEDFQKKYMDDVLAPWDATKASGIVYLTTIKKINQIACGVPLSLDANELGVIETYKSGALADASGTDTLAATANPLNGADGTAANDPDGGGIPDVAQAADDNSNLVAGAALGGGNMVGRFWAYLVGLFQ